MKERIAKLRAEMKKKKISAFFITNLFNIRYLTGLNVSVVSMLVTKDTAEVFLDKRYSEMALKKPEKAFSIIDSSKLREALQNRRSIAFEADCVSVEQLTNWKRQFKNKKFIHTSGLIKGLRRFKDAQEIQRMRRASRITKSVLRVIPSILKKGISEIELARRIEAECLKRGADSMAFETIVGFAENTSQPHHRPTTRKFALGDIVQIDMGARYEGYCSDFSRVFVTGKLHDRERKAFTALKKAKQSVEKMIEPGVSTHGLDAQARTVLKEYGYDEEFCHALGHGLGLEIHEGVTISTKRPNQILKSGDVITIEPGLYFPGKFGMRIEDTYIICGAEGGN